MKMPNLGEAHCGEGAPQSQQRSLEEDFWISRSWCFCQQGSERTGERLRRGTFDLVSGSTSHMALLAMLIYGRGSMPR
jgi:hypothetical protein